MSTKDALRPYIEQPRVKCWVCETPFIRPPGWVVAQRKGRYLYPVEVCPWCGPRGWRRFNRMRSFIDQVANMQCMRPAEFKFEWIGMHLVHKPCKCFTCTAARMYDDMFPEEETDGVAS